MVNGKAEVLKRAPIFSGLSDEDLNGLAGLAIERSFAGNEFIFWEGDAPEWFYIVSVGRVKVLKHSSQGRDFIVAFFGPGEMFGEVAVFENKPYPASAQPIAETRVVGIKRDDLLIFPGRTSAGSSQDYWRLEQPAERSPESTQGPCLGKS